MSAYVQAHSRKLTFYSTPIQYSYSSLVFLFPSLTPWRQASNEKGEIFSSVLKSSSLRHISSRAENLARAPNAPFFPTVQTDALGCSGVVWRYFRNKTPSWRQYNYSSSRCRLAKDKIGKTQNFLKKKVINRLQLFLWHLGLHDFLDQKT